MTAAAVRVLLAACGTSASGSGPLVAVLDGGGNSLFLPRRVHGTWHATFGSLLVCSASPVTLRSVTPRYRRGQARRIHFVVRRVPAVDDRTGPDEEWEPLITWERPLARLRRDGDVRAGSFAPVDGAGVAQGCGTDPDAAYTEILTTSTVDTRGFWIDRLDISYQAGGHSYTLPVHWSYVACGRATARTWAC